MPRMIERAEEKYPDLMRRWEVQGDLLTEFTVGVTGEIKNIKMLLSPHPALEYAAVQTLLASKFSPAKVNGNPATMKLRIPFSFRFDDTSKARLTDSDATFAFPKKPSNELPEAQQYDTPPTIKVVPPVVYPRHLLQARKTGRAKLLVMVDDYGTVRGVNVIEATYPDFGEAAKAMMFAWEFAPAKKAGKAIATTFVFEQKFERTARDTWITPEAAKLLRAIESNSDDIVELDALDKRPTARYSPSPIDTRASDAPAEQVVVEFFIDSDGGVQFPAIKSAKTAELGWAAATALRRWIFEQPTVNGKPAAVRREMQFDFK